MRILLFFLSFVPFLMGVVTLSGAISAPGIGSIAAFSMAGDMFLIWAILFVGASIVDAVVNGSNKLAKLADEQKLSTGNSQASNADNIVDQEINTGLIHTELWDQARESAGSDDSDIIQHEYRKLRMQYLSRKEVPPVTAFPVK